MPTSRVLIALVPAVAFAIAACDRSAQPSNTPAPAAPAPTNRVDIGPAVRQNLGITFAKVERRAVARTLRIPGRFELQPTAAREYRVPSPGKVELLVQQYQRVEAGTPLYRLDAPRWRELQRELAEADAAVRLAKSAVESIGPYAAAHEKHHTELERSVEVWAERVKTLEALREAGGGRGVDISQAQASLATVRAQLAETLEKEAELVVRRTESVAHLEAARTQARILLEAAASLTGLSAAELAAPAGDHPKWQTLPYIEVRAAAPGVVNAVQATTGTFVDSSAAVLSTVQPELVRFRADALQSDLGRLTEGLKATVVAPQGGSLAGGEAIKGTLSVAPTADAGRRTIEVVMTPLGRLPAWARAGVSGFLEVVTAGSGDEELAIPLGAVVRDGAAGIIFRRDPANPDKAIRMEADLGIDDGRWVVVKSGLGEGNEVVVEGVYPLMIATSATATKGGHFHPDGTFHEGEDK